MVDFRIDVVVDPAKSRAGTQKVERQLDKVETEANELQQALVRALSVRDQGVERALTQINATLERTEEAALITDARISQIGRDIRGEGLEEVKEDLEDVEETAINLRGVLGGIFAGVTIGFLIRELAQLADEATSVRNRLRLVTESSEELAETQEELFRIARSTRSEFGATATIFSRLALQADSLGRSNRELLGFTESLNQAIVLSGATAEEASAGLIQLSQGLAAGALRGDEFRSVSEQLPVVLQVIAEQTGKTRAEIRELAFAGELTADVIIDSFAKARQELAQRFATTVPTIGQAFTVLQNSILESVASLDEATGASALAAESILFVSDNVEAAAAGVATLSTALLFAAGTAFPAATAAVAKFALAALPLTAVAGAVAVVTGALVEMNEILEDTEQALENATREATLTRFAIVGEEIAKAERELAALQETGVILTRTERELRFALEALRAEQQNLRLEAERQTEAERAAAAAKLQNSEAVRDLLGSLREEARLLALSSQEREIEEELAKRAAALKRQDVDLTDERLASVRAEIEALIRSNAEAERQSEILDRIRGPAERYRQTVEDLGELLERGSITQEEFNAAVESFQPKELRAEDPFAEQLESIRAQNEELQIRADNEGVIEEFLLEQARIQREIGDLSIGQQAALFAEVAARVAITSRLEEQAEQEREIARARREQERAAEREERRLERLRQQIDLTGSLQEEEQRLLELLQREPELAEEIGVALEDLRLRQLEASNDLSAGFERAFIKIRREAEDLAAVGEAVVNVFADQATNALVEFATTGTLNFKQFAAAVLEDLIRITARLLIVKALSAFLPGGPATGAGASIASGLTANIGRQGGGTVQPGQVVRVNEGRGQEELFVPDRTGTVLPSAAPAAQSQPPQVTIVNVTDPGEIAAVINSGEVDSAIVNVVARNPGKVRDAQRT